MRKFAIIVLIGTMILPGIASAQGYDASPGYGPQFEFGYAPQATRQYRREVPEYRHEDRHDERQSDGNRWEEHGDREREWAYHRDEESAHERQDRERSGKYRGW